MISCLISYKFKTAIKQSQIGKSSLPRHIISFKLMQSRSCKVWTFSNVIAGSDSTTAVMRALMYNLLAHPGSLQKLRQELLDTDKKSGLAHPYPKWNEVKDLPYLDACVNEAVRLHPPFVLPLERIAPQGGVVIGERHYPEGTCIGMNAYVVNRHRPTFGEDADSWRPERFLVEDLALRKSRENGIMTVSFPYSKRGLFDQSIAKMECIVWGWKARVSWEMGRLYGDQEDHAGSRSQLRCQLPPCLQIILGGFWLSGFFKNAKLMFI